MLLLSMWPTAAGRSEASVGLEVSETVTIPADDYRAYRILVETTDRVVFRVRVVTGSAVDVYLTDEFNYARYRGYADGFASYLDGTKENTREFASEIRTGAPGDYVLIVDNQVWTDSGALPRGQVYIEVMVEKDLSARPMLLLQILALAGSVGIVAALVLRYGRRGGAREPTGPR